MARFYPVGGAGGIASLDFVTAEAGDILGGKVGADKDGEPVNGLLVLSGNAAASDVSSGKTFYTTDPKSKQTGTLKECGQSQTAGGWGSGGSGSDAYFAMNRIPEGIYRSGGTDWGPEVRMKQSDVRSAIGATNSANWRSTVTIAGLKGTMPQQGGSTTTPGTGNKTIVSANRFVTGNIIVAGDADLKAANIKKGVNIFGVTGTFEGWVPTNTDLYKNGFNQNNFSSDSNNVKFESGQIAWSHPNVGFTFTLNGGKAVNLSPYSKLIVEGSWKTGAGEQGVSSEYWPRTFSLYLTDEAEDSTPSSSKKVGWVTMAENSVVTKVEINISSINATKFVSLQFRIAGLNYQSRISRIYLA